MNTMRLYYLLFVAAIFAAIPTTSFGQSIDILFAAYANPCCNGGPQMWSSLVATAGDPNRQFELHAIFNPASGPGTARDSGYLDAAGVGPLADFRDAGGITHGYVATGFGNRSLVAVKADIDAYTIGHYAGFVDGIFFDEMSNNLADVGYYQELHSYVQTRQPGAHTFGNPGTTFTNNSSGQTQFSNADYIGSLDTIVTFENLAQEYETNYTSFPYLENLAPEKISHIVHTQQVWDPAILTTAAARGAGFLMVTDDTLVPDNNPYDALPGYWSQMTSELNGFNGASPPLIVVDGNTSEWANIPVLAVAAAGDNAGNPDFTALQVTNDDDFVYLRYQLDQPITDANANSIYTAIDFDADVTTGFDVFSAGLNGSEFGFQNNFGFGQSTGVFNTGATVSPVVSLFTSLSPTGTTDVEVAIDRAAVNAATGASLFPATGSTINISVYTDSGFDIIGGAYTLVAGTTTLLGDVNLDGIVDFLDIAPLINILTNSGFQTEADINLDGAVNFLDIAPFIGILQMQ